MPNGAVLGVPACLNVWLTRLFRLPCGWDAALHVGGTLPHQVHENKADRYFKSQDPLQLIQVTLVATNIIVPIPTLEVMSAHAQRCYGCQCVRSGQ